MKEFVTPKGTKLPLMDLKGKPYLQVAHRIQWFREERPDWSIETSINFDLEKEYSVGRATITDSKGKIVATGHKLDYASSDHDMDYVERSETGAIGRALAYCGYGTQFAAQDMQEGTKLADAPLNKPDKEYVNKKPEAQSIKPNETPAMKALKEAEAKIARGEKLDAPPVNIPNVAESKLGTYVVKFGKKYNGKALNSIVIEDLIDYVDYLTTSAKNKKEPLSGPALEFVNKANEYLNHQEQKEINEPDFQDNAPWPNEPPAGLADDDQLPF